MLGMFFQQLYNTIDAVIVGRYVGKEALAAVGGGSSTFINLLVGFCGGLASGATIIISQFYGAKKDKELSCAVQTSVFLTIAMGFFMTILGVSLAGLAMRIIGTPEEIYKDAVIYLRIFFAGIIPMFLYNMGSGILRAIGDSKTPFWVLVASCLMNIALDWIFVAIIGAGVSGVAWATVISQIFSTILIFIPLIRTNKPYRFTIKNIRVSPNLLKNMVSLGVPSGLHATMYNFSNLILQKFINAFGTVTIAAWTVWGKIDAIFWLTISSFGMALTTFSGQNYGARNFERIKKGTLQSLLMAYIATVVIIILLRTCGNFFYNMFIPGENEVIKIGMQILMFITPAYFLYVPSEIISGTTRGAGKTMIPMLISLFGICGTRLLWLVTIGNTTKNFINVIMCYPVSWFLSALLFIIYYKSEKWLTHK